MLKFLGHLILLVCCCISSLFSQSLRPLAYNHPGLHVDLGVGLWAWPLPMDYDRDGDLDLVVACPDKPYNGIYFFENPGGHRELPVFKPGRRIGEAVRNLQLSEVNGQGIVLAPGYIYPDFLSKGIKEPVRIPLEYDFKRRHPRMRAQQWKFVDYDSDRDLDLIIGIGDWTDYGWDDAYNNQGEWTNGPLHGYVYVSRNTGSDQNPSFTTPLKILAGDHPIDVYGMPSPNFADFDKDGDLDIICGEFMDGFTYFQNTGDRVEPQYAKGVTLTYREKPIHMDLQMITPVSVDWNKDGFVDLIVGDEDGRVAFVKNTGIVKEGIPQFLPPQYFQQEAMDVKFGALVTPVGFDWDQDGDEDIVCGNTAGYIGWIENLGGERIPKWDRPKYLEADGQPIRITAGPNGSIQGPCEAKWGYTTLSVADWNHDELPDLIVNSIWGKVVWFQNVGTAKKPLLTSPRPVTIEWEGKVPKPAWNWWNPQGHELVSQWRTTPCVIDLNEDGLNDLVMLDHEGFLAFFERKRRGNQLIVSAPKRIFIDEARKVYDRHNKTTTTARRGEGLRLNDGVAGKSGRRKLCFMDWDLDGKKDLMVNGKNIDFFKNMGKDRKGNFVFKLIGPVHEDTLAGHTTSPTSVDWDQDGKPDLLIGAEDGRMYYLANPH